MVVDNDKNLLSFGLFYTVISKKGVWSVGAQLAQTKSLNVDMKGQL